MHRYHQFTRGAFYGVVAALPLLIAYEMLLLASGWDVANPVRNAADVWLRFLLASLEIEPSRATPAMILILLLAIPAVKHRDEHLEAGYLALLLLEALVYSLALGVIIQLLLLVLAALLSQVVEVVMAGALALSLAPPGTFPLAAPMNGGPVQELALSLGAGLFEEFLFRVVLLWMLTRLTQAILAPWLAGSLAVILAAILFSLAHYVGPFGDPFQWGSFLFRFFAGLLFTALYHWRGFAVTAYTHAFYDIRVFLI